MSTLKVPTLTANELEHLSFADAKVLSLDCFDTLLWRNVFAPKDVFFTLCNHPLFKKYNITPRKRAGFEDKARFSKKMRNDSTEVSLQEIYAEILPDAELELINQLIEAEVQLEHESTFLFKPVYDLLIRAKREGLKTIIVSDTYFSAAQILHLVNKPGARLEELIDEIYCSSEYEKSKSMGLFKPVLRSLNLSANQVLHLGDNVNADYHGAHSLAIPAFHLNCFESEAVQKKISSKIQPGLIYLPNIRLDQGMPQLQHQQLALLDTKKDPFFQFGYTAIGGILSSFSQFLSDEVSTLKRAGKKPKLGFLLRDAYLISSVYREGYSDSVPCANLNISRFTAIAASLNTRENILNQIRAKLDHTDFSDLLNQFLLPPNLTTKIKALCKKAVQPREEFIKLILQKSTLHVIFENSRSFRKRLVAHVQNQLALSPGDTLVLIDLGYSGTAQLLLKKILKEDLDVECIGRYLICDEVMESGHDRKGLIDFTNVDARIIASLTGWPISIFEMLCTQNAPSTVDYTATGEPIFSQNNFKSIQHEATDAIQAGCKQFCRDAVQLPSIFQPQSTPQTRWQMALIDLASLLYYPTPSEIECAREFEFDYNLGTEHHMALMDLEASNKDLQSLGMAYLNDSSKQRRTCHALELRHNGLAMSSLMNTAMRFNFSVDIVNSSYKIESISCVLLKASENYLVTIKAHHTSDGFFSMKVPVSKHFSSGILFGKNYEYFEIHSVVGLNIDTTPEPIILDANTDYTFQDTNAVAGQLFKASESGLFFIPSASRFELSSIRIVFRPIVRRLPSGTGN